MARLKKKKYGNFVDIMTTLGNITGASQHFPRRKLQRRPAMGALPAYHTQRAARCPYKPHYMLNEGI